MRSCQTCQKLKWLHKKANVQELFGHQAKEKLETIFEKKKGKIIRLIIAKLNKKIKKTRI